MSNKLKCCCSWSLRLSARDTRDVSRGCLTLMAILVQVGSTYTDSMVGPIYARQTSEKSGRRLLNSYINSCELLILSVIDFHISKTLYPVGETKKPKNKNHPFLYILVQDSSFISSSLVC